MADIRLGTPADAPGCAKIYEPYVRETAISFESTPPSDDEFAERIERTLESHPWLVCERDDAVCGYAYAGPYRYRDAYRWSVESSVYVDEDAQRKGVARGLYESLFAILRLQGDYNVYAGTTVPNPPSVGFHRAMGFEPVGTYPDVGYKTGEWHDVRWFHRALQESATDPDPPSDVERTRSRKGWDAALATGLSALPSAWRQR